MGWEPALLVTAGICMLLVAHAITKYADEEAGISLAEEYDRVRQHKMIEEYYRTKKEEERNG